MSESSQTLSSDARAFWLDVNGWGLLCSVDGFGTAKGRAIGDFDLPYGDGALSEVSLFLSLLICSPIPEVLIPKEM